IDSSGATVIGGEKVTSLSVLIWTTTPWTIPQNKAVAFSLQFSYGIYVVDEVLEGSKATVGEAIIVADTLASAVFAQAKVSAFHRMDTVPVGPRTMFVSDQRSEPKFQIRIT